MKTFISLKLYWAFASYLFMYVAFMQQNIFAQPKNNGQQQIKSASDLEIIRQRVTDDLLEPAVDATRIQKLVATIKPDGSWPGINYIDTSRTGFQHKDHLENMLDLARAYTKPVSPLRGNAGVLITVSKALDFWISRDFICANWWWNEMGTPNLIINTLLLLNDALTTNQRIEGLRIASRASLTGFGARAGGDFVPIAGMVCKQALFKRNEAMLTNALKVMSDQVVITTDRGISADMGFNHRTDHVTSIHTYGTSYVSAFTYWTVKTAATQFSLSQQSVQLLADYYLDGISKAMAFRKYTDPGARNRDLSRQRVSLAAGTDIPKNFVQSTDYRKSEMEEVIAIRESEKPNTLTWDKYFWRMSYQTHQSKNFFTSVRMHSSRQNNVEEPYNDEGLLMHHLADGANFLMVSGKEFDEIFPVWNWQKIPGTTVVQKPMLPSFNQISKKGKSDFVGAVTNGIYSAAAFNFSSVHDPLTAQKAWFFFKDEYVCLGAGIQSTAEYPVATTLTQCLLNGNVVAGTTAGKQTIAKGNRQLNNVQWINHNNVGYIFQQPLSVHVSNQTETGNYRQINHQEWATEAPVNKDLFTLWMDHGTRPQNERYVYTVLPAATPAQTEAYCKKASAVVLSNTAALQAVQHKSLQITQAVFYQPGTIKINDKISLSTESPCILMVKMNNNQLVQLSLTDPTQKLSSVSVKINTPVTAASGPFLITKVDNDQWSVVKVSLPTKEMAGQTVVINNAP